LGGGLGIWADQPNNPRSEHYYDDPILVHNAKPEQYQGYGPDIFTDAAIRHIETCAGTRGAPVNRGEPVPFFVYLATRLIIVDRRSFVTLAKAAAIFTVFLTAHAVVETFTGKSLYTGLGQYCPWAANKGMEYQTRFGLNRAMGPPGETILFGLSLASLVPIIWMLRHEPPPWGRWSYFLTLIAVLGVAATVSSGPYLALLVVLGCLALEYAKTLVKPLILLFVLGCAAIEVISNRHFYHVLADFTMDPESGWYRARLIDVAIEQLPKYWLSGYGFVDPGWGPMINALPRTDAVNDYVVHAMTYGLFGLFAYLAVLLYSVYGVVRTYALTRSLWMKSCCWALISSLLGLLVAMWSVSLFGQMVSQFYWLIGLHGALALHHTARLPTQKPMTLQTARRVRGLAIPTQT